MHIQQRVELGYCRTRILLCAYRLIKRTIFHVSVFIQQPMQHIRAS
jgi:hypothetical protein